jgi:adenylate cyclase
MTVRIMVVDDEADLELLIQHKFKQKIRENIYSFVFARNGLEALDKLKKNPDVRVMVTDINMPQMDGLTLLAMLRQMNAKINTIVISAYGDMDNIRKAMNCGASDFLTKPINFKDLEMSLERMIQNISAESELNEALDAYREETQISSKPKTSEEIPSITIQPHKTFLSEATLVVFGLSSATTLNENLAPQAVVEVTEQVTKHIAEKCIGQGAEINAYLGGAILAIFRQTEHLDIALNTCLQLRQSLEQLQNKTNHPLLFPEIGMAANSGQVIFSNFGYFSAISPSFTPVGQTVTNTMRYQAVITKGKIVIDETLFLQLHPFYQCEKLGQVKFKNTKESTTIYNIVKKY